MVEIVALRYPETEMFPFECQLLNCSLPSGEENVLFWDKGCSTLWCYCIEMLLLWTKTFIEWTNPICSGLYWFAYKTNLSLEGLALNYRTRTRVQMWHSGSHSFWLLEMASVSLLPCRRGPSGISDASNLSFGILREVTSRKIILAVSWFQAEEMLRIVEHPGYCFGRIAFAKSSLLLGFMVVKV